MNIRKNENRRQVSIKGFFDNEKSAYTQFTDKEIFRVVGRELSAIAKGTVVDLGGGPTLNYLAPEVTEIIKVDISDSILLSKGKFEKLAFVLGDASCIPLKDGVADTVIMQHILHHIVTEDLDKTICLIRSSLREAFRILRNQGRLLIVEPCFYGPIFWTQKKVYPFLFSIYNFLGFPPVFFNSLDSLMRELEALFKSADVTMIKAPLPVSCREGWSLELPYWLSVSKIFFISAQKQSGDVSDI